MLIHSTYTTHSILITCTCRDVWHHMLHELSVLGMLQPTSISLHCPIAGQYACSNLYNQAKWHYTLSLNNTNN